MDLRLWISDIIVCKSGIDWIPSTPLDFVLDEREQGVELQNVEVSHGASNIFLWCGLFGCRKNRSSYLYLCIHFSLDMEQNFSGVLLDKLNFRYGFGEH